MNLPLSLACYPYDRVRALIDGRVRPPGIDLSMKAVPVLEIIRNREWYHQYEAAEVSLTQVMLTDPDTAPFIALPIFISRAFRHGSIFVRNDAGISRPEDLIGKAVGVPEYSMVAATWIRGILQDDYAVDPQGVRWVTAGPIPAGLPAGVDVTRTPPDSSLDDLLVDGRLDAFIGAGAPEAYRSGVVIRLFPDHQRVEREYFARTGVFPIMHCIAVRRDVIERDPEVAQSLYQAFDEAKATAIGEMESMTSLVHTLPWLHSSLEKTREVMGSDYWPYGLGANRTALETLAQYYERQHLAGTAPSVERHFMETA